jgi:hypothetical protein
LGTVLGLSFVKEGIGQTSSGHQCGTCGAPRLSGRDRDLDRDLEGVKSRISTIEQSIYRLRPRPSDRRSTTAELPSNARPNPARRVEPSISELRAPEHWVTQRELNAAIEQLRSSIGRDTDRRFQANEQAMETLRELIVQTDSMLERVLENLEAGAA